jgi:hypothetical protein
MKLPKIRRRQVFQAVTASSWLRVSEEEKIAFAAALKTKGLKRTDQDKQTLRILYSSYLCLADAQKEREKVQVGESEFHSFLGLPGDEQEKRLFVVLSSPMWDVSSKDCERFEKALKQAQEAVSGAMPVADVDARLIRELIGMYEQLPKDYLNRALTPLDFDQKFPSLDPTKARIRIMNIVRECSTGICPHEKRILAKYRKVQQIDDWLALDVSAQKELERIIFHHFNRLSVQDQGRLYDLTPDDVWALREDFRAEFFSEGQRMLAEHGIHEFDWREPADFVRDYGNIQSFTKMLNSTLLLVRKIHLHQMVTPPPTVIAFTQEQLKAEIAKVKARLQGGEALSETEQRELSHYLMMLESTLETREAFVPIEEFEAPPSKEQVFAQRAASPIDLARLESTVGSGVVTTGMLYAPSELLGSAEEWAGTGVGMLLEKLAQGLGVLSHPAVVKLMFGALSFGISFFTTEERLVVALKVLGLEQKVRTMEASAAQVFPYLFKLSDSLDRLLLSGVASARDWMTAVSRAMKIIGDPSSTPQQLKAIADELKAAGKGVCAAAASLEKGGGELGRDLQAATDILLKQCAEGGASGLLREVEGQLPHVLPAVAAAGEVVRKAFREKRVIQPSPGIIAGLKRLWFWGAPSGQTPPPETISEIQELGEKLTLLERAGYASERVESMKKVIEFLPHGKALAGTTLAQAGASGYLSVVQPLLGIVQKGLEAKREAVSLGSSAVMHHLQWVDLAREAERYASEGGEALLRHAERLAGKEGWTHSIVKTTAYALPLVSSVVLGTSGFILTPILLSFVANDLAPSAGAYLAPRVRPMWKYLGAISRQAAQGVGKGFSAATRGIGYYLQRAVNRGRYVDEKRIENFEHVLSPEEREFIFQAVIKSDTLSVEDGEELEALWVQYKAKKLNFTQETELVTRLLLGFEELGADELLAINPIYFSMLAPYVQERLVNIVERYNPLTVQEKHSDNYVGILVDHFNALTREQRDEVHLIPPWEYCRLTEEQQRELRFLIVHSTRYREKKEQARAARDEEATVDPSELLKEFEQEPKGEELREFLSLYRDLDAKDIAGITPQQLLEAGEAKILHALSILETYHARWIRDVAEADGRDITLLRTIIQMPPPRSVSAETQKKRLVEALASLCRQMPEHQQSYLLNMTEGEVEELLRDSEKVEKCLRHLSTYTAEGSPEKEALTSLLSTYKEKGVDPRQLCSLFNALSDTHKAEFRQGLQPKADAIEQARGSLLTMDRELIELTEVAEKNTFSLESLVTAAELVRFQGKGKLTPQDEEKIQRYELNASAIAAKLEVIEKRIGELLVVRSKVVEALEHAGVIDIPPLLLEEIEKHDPQRKNELLVLTHIADLEVNAALNFVRQQPSPDGVKQARQLLVEQNAIRMAEGNRAIEVMEKQREALLLATKEGSGIERAKARASLSLLEKRIKFAKVYLEAFRERFSEAAPGGPLSTPVVK